MVDAPSEVWNVGFLIMDGVYNTELTAPMDVFQHTVYHTDPWMRVFTVAKTTEPVTTFEGLHIIPDYGYLDSVPPIDVLVVPSAEGHMSTDLADGEMIRWVLKTGKSARYIMSLCDGAFVLASTTLLNGLASTTFPADIKQYKAMFPHLEVYQDAIFVHDGQAITGAGGARSFEPALYLCELLYGKKVADGIAKGLVIDWDVNSFPRVIK
ncbi:MAG: DJ-1/PfpI family protein [Bacteroidota bacterium]